MLFHVSNRMLETIRSSFIFLIFWGTISLFLFAMLLDVKLNKVPFLFVRERSLALLFSIACHHFHSEYAVIYMKI